MARRQPWQHKRALYPFAEMIEAMHDRVRELTTRELETLLKACESASPTNCWYAVYNAASVIDREVRSELAKRKKKAATA